MDLQTLGNMILSPQTQHCTIEEVPLTQSLSNSEKRKGIQAMDSAQSENTEFAKCFGSRNIENPHIILKP